MEEGFPHPYNAMRLAKVAEGGEEEATTTTVTHTANNNGRPNNKTCIVAAVAMWSEHKAGTNKGL